ncbi:MAG: sigma-70 family RNA polymerase sigma factor [Candidatus Delongbacteria bacterium]|jgi:RNA polymerase sigma-70 factor (ECF subfamily)|nr:sigma-70 family RNA polymerase sigma factor [Candidatus Delongbacteria bacterium]MDY0017668.1 sigma-70 family RNA polymerase sigma factor [Candidatus Delongbacteria bacterium]
MMDMMNLKKLTDEELMLRFQNGDEDSYSELVERYKNKLMNHIFYYMKDRESAEDIVQDTFVRVYLNKEKYKEIAKVSTWIYTIAINLAKTALSRSGKMNSFSITGKDGENDYEIKDKHSSTDRDVLKNELSDIIMSSIDSLEEKFREIVMLRDIDEMSYEEIAALLQIPTGTVKSRLNRARLNLRDAITDYIK